MNFSFNWKKSHEADLIQLKKNNFLNPQLLLCGFGSFLLIVSSKLFLIGEFGNAVPYWDQWNAEAANLYLPFCSGKLTISDLFQPHNEHRIVWARLLALALLSVNGQWDPLLQMLFQAIFSSFVFVVAMVWLAREANGQRWPILWAAITAIVLFPFSWENTLWGFQSIFYFAIFFGFSGIVVTLISEIFGLRWWIGWLSLLLSLFSSAGGVLAPLSVGSVLVLQFFSSSDRRGKRIVAIFLVIALTVLGLLLQVEVPAHRPLKAQRISEFLSFFGQLACWPTKVPLLAPLFLLPIMWAGWWCVTKKPSVKSTLWPLLGLGIWHLLGLAALSYGRANAGLDSRYTDGLAIGLIIILATLLYLGEDLRNRFKTTAKSYMLLLVVLIFSGLWYDLPRSLNKIIARKQLEPIQAGYLVSFLKTGDLDTLKNKPFLHIPYPSGEHLAQILSENKIREILPPILQPGLKSSEVISSQNSFVQDGGLYPTTSGETKSRFFGSYGLGGNATTGTSRLNYPFPLAAKMLEIQVAGYPLSEGMRLFTETNDGLIEPLPVRKNPEERWRRVILKTPAQPFAIVAEDLSLSAWLAVSEPVPVGRLYTFRCWMLKNNWLFASAGTLFFVIGFLQHFQIRSEPQDRNRLSSSLVSGRNDGPNSLG